MRNYFVVLSLVFVVCLQVCTLLSALQVRKYGEAFHIESLACDENRQLVLIPKKTDPRVAEELKKQQAEKKESKAEEQKPQDQDQELTK